MNAIDQANSRPKWALVALWFLLGVIAMIYLNGPGLTNPAAYHMDLSQSPHWMGDSFPEDDLLRRYGHYNESPVQNLIYWLGTMFVDVVLFNKIVGIVIFGLTAALFYALVSSMAGVPGTNSRFGWQNSRLPCPGCQTTWLYWERVGRPAPAVASTNGPACCAR